MHDLDNAVTHAQEERAQAGGVTLPTMPNFIAKALVRPEDFLTKGIAGLCMRRDVITPGQAVWLTADYLFKSLQVNRALVVVRTGAGHVVRAALGPDAQSLLPSLQFGDDDSGSLIQQAVSRNTVVYIEQTPAFTPNAKLPKGWNEKLGVSGTALLLPITVRGRSLGFLYCDWKKNDPNSVLLPGDVRALESLRKALVAVLSGRQVPHPRPRAARSDQVRPSQQ
jgi:transcriptional regulator with GAF, ATPase, and Fis domain